MQPDPVDYYDKEEYLQNVKILPGEIYSPEEQCKLAWGAESSVCSVRCSLSFSTRVKKRMYDVRLCLSVLQKRCYHDAASVYRRYKQLDRLRETSISCVSTMK